MKVRDSMNADPARIALTATVWEAAQLLVSCQAADLMVVDAQDNLVGVLSEGDLIRGAMPKFEELVARGETLSAAEEIFRDNGAKLRAASIESLVIRSAITVGPDTALLQAAAIMVARQIRRLPVVSGGKLVGSISRADVCVGLLSPRR